MANTTTYLVETKYVTSGTGQSASAIDKVGDAAERASRKGDLLTRSLGMLGGGFLITKGLGMAKDSLIGFNAEMETLLISLSTSLSIGLNKSFSDAQASATGLMETFKTMAAESPATTKDFVDMASQISGAVTAAGLGLSDLKDITKGGVVAAAALAGGRSDMIALDIQQMLAGTVSLRDRYARQLLASTGNQDYTAFNAKGASERADIVKRALTGPALAGAAKAYETSFAGVVSTFKDKFQMAMGEVGKPLFAEITKEVATWSDYLDKHEKSLASVGDKLVDAFKAIKAAVNFVVSNRDLLLALATAGVAVKGISWGADKFRGLTDGMSLAGNASKGFADRLGAATGIIAGFSAAGIAAIGYLEAKAGAEVERRGTAAGDISLLRDLTGDIGDRLMNKGDTRDARAILRSAKELGFIDAGGALHGDKMYDKFATANELSSFSVAVDVVSRAMALFPEELRKVIVDWRMPPELEKSMTRMLTAGSYHVAFAATPFGPTSLQNEIGGPLERMVALMETFMGGAEAVGMKRAKAESDRAKAAAKDKDKTLKVKVEIAAKDPDRWLVKDLERARDNGRRAPTRAKAALRGGGL